jgi:hypothetical protein
LQYAPGLLQYAPGLLQYAPGLLQYAPGLLQYAPCCNLLRIGLHLVRTPVPRH